MSQNVAKRLPSSGSAIIGKLRDHRADIIALQEVTLGQVDGWATLLSTAGYENVVRGAGYGRKGGALLASRMQIAPIQLHSSIIAGPRVAAGIVDGIGVASVYFPAGNAEETWSSFYDDLMLNQTTRHFILIGDFQMAVAEIEISSGKFQRWSRDPSYVLLQAMLTHWRDAFRATHGADHLAFSHRHNSGALWLNDHALVPPHIDIVRCEIDWSSISEGLSDHACLVLDVA